MDISDGSVNRVWHSYVACSLRWSIAFTFSLLTPFLPLQMCKLASARQLSLYWEVDLRNPSYFLNKRKELEFFIWNLVDLQYLASYVRGKVTKTIELQGKSPKYQQEYAENDFQIEKKIIFTYFRYFAPHKNFTIIFVYFFVIFWYQSWLVQTSGSDVYFFFTRKDIVHWSKKIIRQRHGILEPTHKFSAS